MNKTANWMICLALLPGSMALAAGSIDWNHWELDAFEAAKTQDKIILVNVGMEGCAACARMEALTYTDSDRAGRAIQRGDSLAVITRTLMKTAAARDLQSQVADYKLPSDS